MCIMQVHIEKSYNYHTTYLHKDLKTRSDLIQNILVDDYRLQVVTCKERLNDNLFSVYLYSVFTLDLQTCPQCLRFAIDTVVPTGHRSNLYIRHICTVKQFHCLFHRKRNFGKYGVKTFLYARTTSLKKIEI